MAAIVLKGITWGHSRGITPLLAASQRFQELFPGTEIRWTQRSLQEFADYPLELLAKDYDLLIIDHPWVGCAAATQSVLPLNHYLDPAYIADQQLHSTGQSHESYNYDGQQWALAIDAATPAASYRPDLISDLPQNWSDLLDLAGEGRVAVPAIPIDLLMNFYTFCIAHGETPFLSEEELVSRETGTRAIETMKELYSRVDTKMFSANPIRVAEWMSSSDEFIYCPFAYCYSNYSRAGFASRLLKYAAPVVFNDQPLQTTIGGTGLAVSACSAHPTAAIAFTKYVVSGSCQRSLYVQHGGQPGHRSAWTDPLSNELTHDFFTTLLPVMEKGYMRPRYNGYLYFQDRAGDPLQECLRRDTDPEKALEAMNKFYGESIQQPAFIRV